MPRVTQTLTDKEVKDKAKVKGRHTVGGVPGLTLVVEHKGGKPVARWLLRIKAGGKEKTYGLGGYPAKTLKKAREEARAMLDAYLQGKPVREPKQIEEKPSNVLTVAALYPQWIEAQRGRQAWKSEDDYRHAEQRGEKYILPIIGDKPVQEVTAQDVGERVLLPIYNAGMVPTAEKVLACLNQFFKWCASRELLDPMKRLPSDKAILEGFLPSKRERNKNKEKRHYAMCPVGDLPRFIAYLTAPERFNNIGAMALLFAILTNSRLANICATHQVRHNWANWKDINLEAKTWTIPAHKMKCPANGAHVVPLSGAAMKILERLQLLGERHGEIVFKNRSGKPLSDGVFRKIIKTISDKAVACGEAAFIDPNIGKLMTQHATSRATFKTWAVNENKSQVAVEKALHHVGDDKLGRAYDRAQALEIRRQLAEEWAAYCLSKSLPDWYKIK